jgi:hypothetical protein
MKHSELQYGQEIRRGRIWDDQRQEIVEIESAFPVVAYHRPTLLLLKSLQQFENPDNRSTGGNRSRQLLRAMWSGRYFPTTDKAGFCEDRGLLTNFHHRLKAHLAFAEEGGDLSSLPAISIEWGIPWEAVQVTDTGKSRTAQNVSDIMGAKTEPGSIPTVNRMVDLLDQSMQLHQPEQVRLAELLSPLYRKIREITVGDKAMRRPIFQAAFLLAMTNVPAAQRPKILDLLGKIQSYRSLSASELEDESLVAEAIGKDAAERAVVVAISNLMDSIRDRMVVRGRVRDQAYLLLLQRGIKAYMDGDMLTKLVIRSKGEHEVIYPLPRHVKTVTE